MVLYFASYTSTEKTVYVSSEGQKERVSWEKGFAKVQQELPEAVSRPNATAVYIIVEDENEGKVSVNLPVHSVVLE